MINPTKRIGIVAIGHATQFSYKLHEHYYALLYMAQVNVVKMYQSKYTVKKYYTYPSPFKTEKR